MKKTIWGILLVVVAGFFFTACSMVQEAPLCGGVTDRTDHFVPKVIKSKEIVEFSASFWITDEQASRSGHWNLQAGRDSSGRLIITSEGAFHAQDMADAAFLISLQDIIDRFELAKFNGIDRVTAGLPPEFSPTRLRVDYSSGERLYFQRNGDPGASWTRELVNLFLSALPER